MNPKEIDLDKIIINYIQNESRKRLYENNSTNINKDNNLNFEVLLYDEYNNKINETDNNNLNVKFKGLESEINLCQEKKESSILIVLCDDKNNNNNWYYLVNGEYFLEAEYKNKIKTYSLRVDGQFENGSNGKIDVSNTFISTNEIKIIAGDYKSFTVELRTNDEKGKITGMKSLIVKLKYLSIIMKYVHQILQKQMNQDNIKLYLCVQKKLKKIKLF